MRALLKTSSLVLLLGALLGNGQPHDQAQADDRRAEPKRRSSPRVLGEHELHAAARPWLQLVLKPGFEVKLSKSVLGQELVLRVATSRASSQEIAVGFVPIGPTVELSGAEGDVDVSFAADQFHVRTGHQLILARERSGPCSADDGCWQLVPARYEGGRCVARAVRVDARGPGQQSLSGQRMQFGSVPGP